MPYNGNGNGYNGNGYLTGAPFDVRYVVEVFFRRKWWIIGTFIIVFSFSVYKVVTQPTYYKAFAVIEFSSPGGNVGDVVDVRDINSRIGLFQQRIRSVAYVEKVMRLLNIGQDVTDPKEYEKILAGIRGSIGIRKVGINALQVAFVHQDPKIAKDIVETLLSNYVEEESTRRRQELATAIDFVTTQLEIYYQKIRDGEAKLRALRLKRSQGADGSSEAVLQKLMSMPGMYRYGTERMADLQFRLVELDTQLAVLNERKKLIEKEMRKVEGGKVVVIPVESPKIKRMRETMAEYEKQLEELLVRCKEDHPMVVELKKAIETLHRKIQDEKRKPVEGMKGISPTWRELARKLQTIDQQIEELEMKKREVMILVNVYGKSYRGAKREDLELIQLMRNNRINARLVEMLQNKLESLRMTQQLELTSNYIPFTYLDRPRIPQIPLPRKTKRLLIMGLLLAFAFSGGVGYIFELVDQTVKRERDIYTALHIPSLATIPKVKLGVRGSYKYNY